MKKIKIEKEPKLQFNRGNPDSPLPQGRDDHDSSEDDKNQIANVDNHEDLSKDGEKKARKK